MKENILPSLPTNSLLVFVGVFLHPFTLSSPEATPRRRHALRRRPFRWPPWPAPRRRVSAPPRRRRWQPGDPSQQRPPRGTAWEPPFPSNNKKWWTKCVGFFFEGCIYIYTMYSWCTGYIYHFVRTLSSYFFATSLFWTWKKFHKKTQLQLVVFCQPLSRRHESNCIRIFTQILGKPTPKDHLLSCTCR